MVHTINNHSNTSAWKKNKQSNDFKMRIQNVKFTIKEKHITTIFFLIIYNFWHFKLSTYNIYMDYKGNMHFHIINKCLFFNKFF